MIAEVNNMTSTITISTKEYNQLRYDSETANIFYEENKILKKEFYKQHERVMKVEEYKREIEQILANSKMNCSSMIEQIQKVTA